LSPTLGHRGSRVENWINGAAPATLVEAAVKLRRLADPQTGLEAGAAEGDIPSIRQVLALIERGGAQDRGDDELLSVFRRWRQDIYRAERSEDEAGDVDRAPADAFADTIYRLAETPAHGATGLALKAYALIYQDLRRGAGRGRRARRLL